MAESALNDGKAISLALQGGGAHGAFTWGVLDHLLEDGRLSIKAISGASAGAMNAVCLADGWLENGRDGARAQLERFWRAISIDGKLSEAQRAVFNRIMGAWALPLFSENPFLEFLTTHYAPAAINPLHINPLKDVLEQEINFERLRKARNGVKLFVSATDVRAGRIAVFKGSELTAEHVLASACLPKVFEAVEINGRAYWDGGYMGNPALFPLFTKAKSADILLVQINAVVRDALPVSAEEIDARLNEITFNAPLLSELRAIDFVARLKEEKHLADAPYTRVLMHALHLQDALKDLDGTSKLQTDWDFFVLLRDAGRKAAKAWLKRHFDDIGIRQTFDIRKEFTGTLSR
jgi:NTE family protein